MSKLPLKSLYRFKCVHKSWAILFENPNFMNIYRKNFILKNHSYYDDTCLLLKHMVLDFESHCVLHLCSGERLNSKVKLDWPPPFQKDDRDINILGSGINGILCLYDEGISSRVVLWNPAIDEFKVIPPSPVESLPHYVICEVQHHGFGYDSIGDDYKVIRYVKFHSYLHYFSSDRKNFPWLNVVYDPLWENHNKLKLFMFKNKISKKKRYTLKSIQSTISNY
ncbi:putative F-box protein At3g16210 [Cicer arietinum]|uniref:putative F-box protein At3g16210 n=1 Tax=Cicer arietinum TaxID=3827 RepID=UPI003CC57487